jgi:hypothetical protein
VGQLKTTVPNGSPNPFVAPSPRLASPELLSLCPSPPKDIAQTSTTEHGERLTLRHGRNRLELLIDATII